MIVGKECTIKFSAAHFMTNYTGLCRVCHGHNFFGTVEVEGKLRKNGMVVDFKDIKEVVQSLNKKLHHKFLVSSLSKDVEFERLNTVRCRVKWRDPNAFIREYIGHKDDFAVLPIKQSSAECLALWFKKEITKKFKDQGLKIRVRLYENDTSYAEV